MTPWYTDQEIDDLCAGLCTSAAKVRHLRAQGLTVTQKPNGRPLVIRAHADLARYLGSLLVNSSLSSRVDGMYV